VGGLDQIQMIGINQVQAVSKIVSKIYDGSQHGSFLNFAAAFGFLLFGPA